MNTWTTDFGLVFVLLVWVVEGAEPIRCQAIDEVGLHTFLLPTLSALYGILPAMRCAVFTYMEAIQWVPDGLCDTPGLAAAEDGGGNHGPVEQSCHSWCHLFLGDDLGYSTLDLTCALEITHNGWRAAVVADNDAAQVFEGLYLPSGGCMPPPFPLQASAVVVSPQSSGTASSARATRSRRPGSAACRAGTCYPRDNIGLKLKLDSISI